MSDLHSKVIAALLACGLRSDGYDDDEISDIADVIIDELHLYQETDRRMLVSRARYVTPWTCQDQRVPKGAKQ